MAAESAQAEWQAEGSEGRSVGGLAVHKPASVVDAAITNALTTLNCGAHEGTDDSDDLETRVLTAYQQHRNTTPDPLSLVLVGGFAGSGKSEFARFLSSVTGWTILDKDALTRALVEQLLVANGCDINDRHTKFYMDDVRPFEYRCLLDASIENLRCGVSTVITAPFVREFSDGEWFTRLQNRCAAHRARLNVVWMRCDEESMHDYIAFRGAARDSWKLRHWQDYLATINVNFAPPFHHHSVDNRLNAAVALADQARDVAAKVRA
jgi:predicted kinase